MLIDWESNESLLLLNPAYTDGAKTQFTKILEYAQQWPAHLWLATSGSTAVKWVGLSKQAILTSAHAVNQHLQSTATDRWALALPDFHVGGLGIYARSHLSNAPIDNFTKYFPKWSPHQFCEFISQHNSTLTALVPAQLHDLVQLNLSPPPSLRSLIIGGGQLLPELFQPARQLGWKVMPSYGMTECASQIATANLNSDQSLHVLSHLQVRIMDGRLAFKGDSLLTTYAYCDERGVSFVDPKIDGWFISEDRGTIDHNILTIYGRADQLIKIGGENVDVAALEAKLQSIRLRLGIKNEVALVPVPHPRLGYEIILALAGINQASIQHPLIKAFNASVLPFERIRGVHCLESFPKSSLSKILRQDLLKQIKYPSIH